MGAADEQRVAPVAHSNFFMSASALTASKEAGFICANPRDLWAQNVLSSLSGRWNDPAEPDPITRWDPD